MEDGPLLKPMPPDALTRRRETAYVSAPAAAAMPFAKESPKDPECMRIPEFAPLPVKKAPEADLTELLAPYMADEEDDEPEEDAVPTHLMPVPVCVPLYEEIPSRRRRGKR